MTFCRSKCRLWPKSKPELSHCSFFYINYQTSSTQKQMCNLFVTWSQFCILYWFCFPDLAFLIILGDDGNLYKWLECCNPVITAEHKCATSLQEAGLLDPPYLVALEETVLDLCLGHVSSAFYISVFEVDGLTYIRWFFFNPRKSMLREVYTIFCV